MIRRTLNIGNYQYVLDLFSIEEDNMTVIKKKFIMLRNFTIVNNIISDTNIFIIDHDTWLEMCKDLDSQEDNYFPKTTHIAFPILTKKIDGFSNSPMEYNSNFTKESFYKKNQNGEFEYGKDIYPLLDKNGNSKYVLCNILRLYHPNNKLRLNGIICVENYINNIHFYYLCKPLSNYTYNSETEFTVNNHIYSEYIEIYFPNLNELYKLIESNDKSDIYNVYFNENMNTIVSTKNEIFLSRMIQSNEGLEKYSKFRRSEGDDGGYLIFRDQYVPLNLLLQPFQIVEDIDPFTNETYNVKIYLKNKMSLENNYISNPFNISIFPYSGIDIHTNDYILDETLNTVNTSYSVEYKFSLLSKLGFDSSNHKISIISRFQYPNKDNYIKYNDGNTSKALQSAYKYFYNINEDNYKYFWANKLRIDFPEKVYPMLQEFEAMWNKQEIINGVENYIFKKWVGDEQEQLDELSENEQLRRMIKKNWKGIYDELRDPEVEEEFETGMDFIGFKIQIATDSRYKNLIYNETITIDFDQLDDFTFNINNIFDNWNELPDFLVGRTIFIDRIISRVIVSNSVIISKELFKYIINNNNVYSINLLNYYNKTMKEIEFKNANATDIFEEYTNGVEGMNKLFFTDLNNKISDAISAYMGLGISIENEDETISEETVEDAYVNVSRLLQDEKDDYENKLQIYKDELREIVDQNSEEYINKKTEIDNTIIKINELSEVIRIMNNIQDLSSIKILTDTYQSRIKELHNKFKNDYFSKYIPFNFVNNINCIINKPQNNLSNINKDYQQKIIYKPIFFRTQDLQNIRLRNGVTQKIGINLSNYMTKVDTFKLVIEGIEFVENSRNDIYVIFEVNSNILTGSSGKYNIVNQDDEYISSGNWLLY